MSKSDCLPTTLPSVLPTTWFCLLPISQVGMSPVQGDGTSFPRYFFLGTIHFILSCSMFEEISPFSRTCPLIIPHFVMCLLIFIISPSIVCSSAWQLGCSENVCDIKSFMGQRAPRSLL